MLIALACSSRAEARCHGAAAYMPLVLDLWLSRIATGKNGYSAACFRIAF